MNNNYQRLFYIFQSMDNELGNPTGYIKVEINGPTTKLQISLNNMVYRMGMEYKLYGIKCSDDKLEYTVICNIDINNGRADIKVSMDTDNIGSNPIDFDSINVFALIAQLPDKYNSIVCPLVTYKSGHVKWKHIFEAELKKAEQANDVIPSPIGTNTQDNNENCVKNNYEAEEQSLFSEAAAEQDELSEVTVGDLSDLVEVSDENADTTEDVEQQISDDDSARQQFARSETLREEDAADSAGEVDNPGHTTEFSTSVFKGDNSDNITSKFESTLTSIYRNETGTDNFLADTDIIGTAQQNFKEISSINIQGDKVRNELDLNILREELDKSFEPCNPFNTRSKRFVWWKINSPGYLNNILFRNNVKTYLLFNPKVMLAHYKYRYIIFGIRYDKYSGRERFVCGVPGVYSIDENPFGSMGSWAQLEGFKPKYGAFGYWIILIDPRTGKLIKIK